jgi:hypothetical protein
MQGPEFKPQYCQNKTKENKTKPQNIMNELTVDGIHWLTEWWGLKSELSKHSTIELHPQLFDGVEKDECRAC